MTEHQEPVEQFKQAVLGGDAARLRALLENQPSLKSSLDNPQFFFDSPAVVVAAGRGQRGVLDVLLASGANINARSAWWAGGFGVLDNATPEMAAYLIEHGALVDIHAAAHLGMIERLRDLVAADPEAVHARGGDGKTPLHFASTVEIAEYLIEHGARLDTLDIDHESTAAQHLIGDHTEVARYLVERGAKADILLAAALGDAALVRKHLEDNPDSIAIRVNGQSFPKQNPRAGGTIYMWTLGGNRSPHQVAWMFGHPEIVELLMDRSPLDVKLINACLLGKEPVVREILAGHPEMASILTDANCQRISEAAEDNNTAAVRLMLECGWPVDGGDRETPLHWAAWHGNAEMVRVILGYHPSLERASAATFDSPPLGWAVHGSENSWHRKTGDYGAVVRLLLAAGAKPPARIEGSEAVRAALTPQPPKA